jgi:hypothetical protein
MEPIRQVIGYTHILAHPLAKGSAAYRDMSCILRNDRQFGLAPLDWSLLLGGLLIHFA